MSVEISREIETRLADEAKRLGISVDALIERYVKECAVVSQPTRQRPELPIWHLGGAVGYHRRDRYDDVR